MVRVRVCQEEMQQKRPLATGKPVTSDSAGYLQLEEKIRFN